MGQERRRMTRLESNFFVEFETSMQEVAGRGVVVDVSIAGLAVDTEAELNIGDVLLCHAEIPFTVKAKVVRQVKPGQMKRYGLQFVGQSFIEKLLLRKLLKGERKTRKVSA
jgi:hypothetical protein